MKAYFTLLALTLSLIASAATWAQTVTFTLGAPVGNTIPVLSIDGIRTDGVWDENYLFDCSLKGSCYYVWQQHINLTLPSSPVQERSWYCTGTQTENTLTSFSTTPRPNAVVQSNEVCTTDLGTNWSGSVSYIYAYQWAVHCSSGHAGGCKHAYFPVQIGGAGSLEFRP